MKKAKESRTAVVLNGSPRPRGNTAVVIGWLEDALGARGFEVERVDLYRMAFKGCAHCERCKEVPDRPGCALKDPFSPLLDRIVAADLVVLASPVYCWAVTACAKAALDRFYALFKGDRSLVEGKRFAGLFTAGGDAFDGMDLCVETLRRIVEYGKADYVGTIAAVDCGEPGDVRRMTQVRRAAGRLARAL
jgi:multimeric flavodoxin WrbA